MTKSSATFAEQPGAIPNYIFPLASSQFYSAANVFQFQYLMYRPLYSFGANGQVQLNNALSLAYPPVYSNDGKSVTLTSEGVEVVGRGSDHRSGHPVLAKPGHRQQGDLAGVRPRGVSGQRPELNHQPSESAPDHVHPQPRVRILFLHVQRAQSDHPAAPAPLGQGIGNGCGGNLRRDAGRRTGRLQVPRLAVTGGRHLRHQPALERGLRPLEAHVHRHRRQRADGPESPIRGARQTDAEGLPRTGLPPGERRVEPAQGGYLRGQHGGGFRLPPCRGIPANRRH